MAKVPNSGRMDPTTLGRLEMANSMAKGFLSITMAIGMMAIGRGTKPRGLEYRLKSMGISMMDNGKIICIMDQASRNLQTGIFIKGSSCLVKGVGKGLIL